MKKALLKIYFYFAAIIFVLFLCLLSIMFFLPQKYGDIVNYYSKLYNLEPSLVFSVINTESGFNTNAVSRSNALGLMQIMPTTAEYIAKELNLKDYDLFNPKDNIDIGCWYLRKLLNKYNNQNTALCAYNAGSGNVDLWLNNKDFSEDGINLKSIPFKETKNYVRLVNIYRTFYTKLFNL